MCVCVCSVFSVVYAKSKSVNYFMMSSLSTSHEFGFLNLHHQIPTVQLLGCSLPQGRQQLTLLLVKFQRVCDMKLPGIC